MCVGGLTLWAASRAAHWAKEAAKATTQTLHNERAWLLLDASHLRNEVISGEMNGEPFEGIRLVVFPMNKGHTPARDICLFAHYAFGNTPPQNLEFPNAPVEEKICGPGVRTTGAALYIDTVNLGRMRAREIKGYVYYRVTYRDIFTSETRVSQECFQVDWEGNRRENDSEIDIWALSSVPALAEYR